jgi:hypothetical protein
MKPQLTSIFADDKEIEQYLRSMNIDELEKKLTVASDNVLDLWEEYQDAVSFKQKIDELLREKRGVKK